MIPVYRPSLTGNEKKYVNDCIDSSWISAKGKYNDFFSQKFSEYVGVKYATTVTNGTLALHLALMAIGVGPGDEVILPTFTYIASANAVKYTGADVIFADSNADSWQIDPDDIERKITDRTKVIMPVHLYGHPCDMDRILEIAKKHKLYIVEDCAEAVGSEYDGRKAGSFGDISAFSFFGNKTITCGEGGMIVTNNEELFEKALHLKGQGLVKDREYWHDIVGYNYRMTNIAAAIGLAQLEQVDEFVNRKIQIAEMYESLLENVPVHLHKPVGNVKHSYWMVSIVCDEMKDRDSLRKWLKEREIETRPTFFPIHSMPMYYKESIYLPVADRIALSGINLPSFPALKDEEIEYICEQIKLYYLQ